MAAIKHAIYDLLRTLKDGRVTPKEIQKHFAHIEEHFSVKKRTAAVRFRKGQAWLVL